MMANSEREPILSLFKETCQGSEYEFGYYYASTITGGNGERMPSNNELTGARFQGAHIARIALKFKG
jgi:multimeric flavodoxin WrbA